MKHTILYINFDRRMVKICNDVYPESPECAEHFSLFPYELSAFQKYSIDAIVRGHHVLVCAPTGSGKTLPSEFAIQYFVSRGKKVIYCSPIKALSNQKFYEFSKKYPEISFGIQTGDIKSNPNADVSIMTTEILMNYLFTNEANKPIDLQQFQIDINNELACVVFDEVHYINDESRGNVWEKTILMLPEHVQMVMLSATIDNPAGFAQWCEERYTVGKEVWLAYTNYRIVPLTHYGFVTTTEGFFKSIKNKDLEKEVREKTNSLILLQDHKGKFNEDGYRIINKVNDLLEKHQIRMYRKHVLNQLALYLRDREILPAIAFVFSRKHVELCANEITIPLLEDDSKVGYNIRRECEQIVRKLPNYREYLELPEYNKLLSLLEKGIGIHHSGMIPVLREIVELMISKRYIKLLFATESFAIGLDCPIKTAIFTSVTKYDGRMERYLMSHEYTQMAGRAGRRGIDTLGFVVHCNNLFKIPALIDYKSILSGIPQKLISKYHVSYGLIMNLLKSGPISFDCIREFSRKSMVNRELDDAMQKYQTEMDGIEMTLCKKRDSLEFMKTPKSDCELYIEYESKHKTAVNKKRKELEREMQMLKDKYRTLAVDLNSYKELLELEKEKTKTRNSFEYMKEYISYQTESICKIMIDEGFVDKNEKDEYELTITGNIASNIAEIHPLILTKFFEEWRQFTPIQMVGLFSCFTDIKVADDEKKSIHTVEDGLLRKCLIKVQEEYNKFETREVDVEVQTGIKYEGALIYDMINISMKWAECIDEVQCKEFIYKDVAERGISIGDFTKGLMKIVTIGKEWSKVCEQMGYIDTLYNLNQIDELLMKYVTTSQSLYV